MHENRNEIIRPGEAQHTANLEEMATLDKYLLLNPGKDGGAGNLEALCELFHGQKFRCRWLLR